MQRLLSVLPIVAALAACSASISPDRTAATAASTQSNASGDTLSIRLGQSAFADGGRLELRFDGRIADSRCPANANCVWMGDAHVRVTTRVANGTEKSAELHTALEPRRLVVDRYVITMVGLTPYPGLGDDNATPVVIVRVASE